jgi:hypothetical protein
VDHPDFDTLKNKPMEFQVVAILCG